MSANNKKSSSVFGGDISSVKNDLFKNSLQKPNNSSNAGLDSMFIMSSTKRTNSNPDRSLQYAPQPPPPESNPFQISRNSIHFNPLSTSRYTSSETSHSRKFHSSRQRKRYNDHRFSDNPRYKPHSNAKDSFFGDSSSSIRKKRSRSRSPSELFLDSSSNAVDNQNGSLNISNSKKPRKTIYSKPKPAQNKIQLDNDNTEEILIDFSFDNDPKPNPIPEIKNQDLARDFDTQDSRVPTSDSPKTTKPRPKSSTPETEDLNRGLVSKCKFCFSSSLFHRDSLISIGNFSLLTLPPISESLSPFHTRIVPIEHCKSLTTMSDLSFTEVDKFRESLTTMFVNRSLANHKRPDSVIFIETVSVSSFMTSRAHTYIDCIPLSPSEYDIALDTWKTAISQISSEFSENPQLIYTAPDPSSSLSSKRLGGIRNLIPPHFNYVSVELRSFSNINSPKGLIYIVNDPDTFNSAYGKNWALSIVQSIKDQVFHSHSKDARISQTAKRISTFLEIWKPFDWTLELE